MNNILVSLIVPALAPTDEFHRCISAIRAALIGQVDFEILAVVKDLPAFADVSAHGLTICGEEEPGIYGAMNKGARIARGRYLYFIGVDDILLPSFAAAVLEGAASDSALILADVYYGKGKIYRNYAVRTLLSWRNWCHQGILYEREQFLAEIGHYPSRYRVQADHFVNLVYAALPGVRICRFEGCIAWYAGDGFSSRTADVEFRRDFPGIVRKYVGPVSYAMVLVRRFGLESANRLSKRK